MNLPDFAHAKRYFGRKEISSRVFCLALIP